MPNNRIDSITVKQIVRDFLVQGHAVHNLEEPILEDHTWTVEADVTSFGVNHTKKVKIDSETGRIMGYELLLNPKTSNI